MILKELRVTGLRNIISAQFTLHPHINLISGSNGSGKTSFLESIYLAGTGHSFRSRDMSTLIRHGQDILTVFALTDIYQEVSIQKSLHHPTVAKIQSRVCMNSSELAAFLPVQLFYHSMFEFIDEGPSVRRLALDWGLFHVEHQYHTLWKDYRRALKQRNALLKQAAPRSLLTPWSEMMSDLALNIDAMRQTYIHRLNEVFIETLADLDSVACTLDYYRGWDKRNEHKTLAMVLDETLSRDLQRQYTHYGVHHADLIVKSNSGLVKHGFSRGQQKTILFALKLAQAKLLQHPCIFLIDDLAAELDEDRLRRMSAMIQRTEGQFFLTTRPADQRLFNFQDFKIYKVHEGDFTPNVSRETHSTS